MEVVDDCYVCCLNVVVFIIAMVINNCPKKLDNCVLKFLARFLFQSLKENPLLGSSSSMYVSNIPMILVNGSEGIGTGWSYFVPNYNPRDIIGNIIRRLNDKPLQALYPWQKGFKGTIKQTSTKENGVTYMINDIIEDVDETTLRITELPVQKWTQDYNVEDNRASSPKMA